MNKNWMSAFENDPNLQLQASMIFIPSVKADKLSRFPPGLKSDSSKIHEINQEKENLSYNDNNVSDCHHCNQSISSISVYDPILRFSCNCRLCFPCYQKIKQEQYRQAAEKGLPTIKTDRSNLSCCLCETKGELLTAKPPVIYLIKISNISWDLTVDEVIESIRNLTGRKPSFYQVHIPIDKISGKTKNFVFVEVEKEHQSQLICLMDNKIFKERVISVVSSSMMELVNAHFINAQPDLGIYLQREEINNILAICRNYKLYFSRKCAERPFEHIISLLRLVPWQSLTLIARDHFFELCKLALEALKSHLYKPSTVFTQTPLDRLLAATTSFPVFTEKQKATLGEISAKKDSNVKIQYIFKGSDTEANEIEQLRAQVARLTLALEAERAKNGK